MAQGSIRRGEPTEHRRQTSDVARAVPWVGWGLALAVGAYLRWSYLELSEFGIDQQTALHLARLIRRGWEYPAFGLVSSFGGATGPVGNYLMAVPLYFSDAPEVATAYVALLGLIAGAVFSLTVWRYAGPLLGVGSLLLYATGPWAVYFTRKIWNPDSLPVFTALAFFLLAEALIKRRRWALPAALLVYGLETQVYPAALAAAPGLALLLTLFHRRLRLGDLLPGLTLFVLTWVPYLSYSVQTGLKDVKTIVAGSSLALVVDALSLDLFQSLIAGADFPAAIGLQFPPGTLLPQYPGIVAFLVFATWSGMALVAWRLAADARRGEVAPAQVVGAIALSWSLSTIVLIIPHSFSLFFRYELQVLPIAFLFPAVFTVELARVLSGLAARLRLPWARTAPRQAAVALALIVFAIVGLRGTIEVEAVHRALLRGSVIFSGPAKDAYSGPPIRDCRAALSALERIVRPDRDTVVVGWVPRGPLEYLADNRYRLRYVDEPTVLVIPSAPTTLVFLPEAEKMAERALKLGATERRDLDLRWPPTGAKLRVLDVDPTRTAPDGELGRPTERQLLPVGLDLLAAGVERVSPAEFDLLSIWRVANVGWAHKYWLYNSFVNLRTLGGEPVAAAGELELPTSSGWQQGDLLIIPTTVKLKRPLPRGLYLAEMGVYVRFPARAPIPTEAGSVPVASLGRLRLGQPASAPATGLRPLADFGATIHLVSATVDHSGDRAEAVLVWQAETEVPADYSVFAHVYDAAGKLVAQSDGWPAEGNYPTSAWLPGEYVEDRRAIALPPDLAAGVYTVKVGLYDASSMQRLPTAPPQGDNAVTVGHIEIGG